MLYRMLSCLESMLSVSRADGLLCAVLPSAHFCASRKQTSANKAHARWSRCHAALSIPVFPPCSAWRYEAELSPAEAQQQQQQRQTNGWEQATTSGVAAADVTLGLQSPQHASQNAVAGQSNVQDAQVSDRATLLELSPPSRGLLKLSSGLPDTKSSQMLLQPCLSALPSTELLSPRTPRMAAALAQDETAALGLCSTDGRCGQRRVHVSCHHNGTYAFKGCGALDMVCVTSDVLAAESRARSNVVQKGSKGKVQQLWLVANCVRHISGCKSAVAELPGLCAATLQVILCFSQWVRLLNTQLEADFHLVFFIC